MSCKAFLIFERWQDEYSLDCKENSPQRNIEKDFRAESDLRESLRSGSELINKVFLQHLTCLW
jgi:hypothetical protein